MKNILRLCLVLVFFPFCALAQTIATDASVASQPSTTGDQSPTVLDKAAAANDPKAAIDDLVGMKTTPDITQELREDLETIISSYVKPLPASNAEENMRGYQALSVLFPDNDTYKKKAGAYKDAFERQKYAILGKLKKTHVDFDNRDWYEHPNVPRYTDTRNFLEVYMGEKDTKVWLRIKLNYTGDSWLFIKDASANIDGKTVKLPLTEWKRDNDSEIWEWSDQVLTPELRDIMIRIADSKKTIIRFNGSQYYDDWTVPAKDKVVIREMILAEKMLKDKIASK